MKRLQLSFAVAVMAFFCMASCKTTNEPKEAQMVDVTVSMTGFEIQVIPEDGPRNAPMASDKGASEAYVKYIALNIYDATSDTLVASFTQNAFTDSENFGQPIQTRLRAASYKFVAVACTLATNTDPLPAINSVSAISLGSGNVYNPTYTTLQNVTITGNTTQSVSIDMGTRKNSIFNVDFTDANPDDVKKLQIVVSPTSSAYTDLIVTPSTGLTSTQYKYEKVYVFANLTGFKSTKGNSFNIPVMLTAASQQLDITINALSATDEVLYTRTLENVTLKQANKTVARGTFFSPNTTDSFVFDVTFGTDIISLDE